MGLLVTSATGVLAGVLDVVLLAAQSALQAVWNISAGQGALPDQLPEAAVAALWDDPAIKAVASADLLGACSLALLYALSGDLLQLVLQAQDRVDAGMRAADEPIASMGVAASGTDGSSTSGNGSAGPASSSTPQASGSTGSNTAASSKEAGTRSRQEPVKEGVLTIEQDAAAWKLACSDTLQLPSPFTHMISLLGCSRRAVIFTLRALHDNHRCVNAAAGIAAPPTAAPLQPIPAPGWLLGAVSTCLMLAGVARQSPFMQAGTLRRLSTIMAALEPHLAALEPQQQQHGQPKAQDTDTPTQQQPQPEQQQVEAQGSDADWEAQMHHTLLAVVLVWLSQKDATANSYAESLSGAADVLSRVVSRIGEECRLAEAEATMQFAPDLMQSMRDMQVASEQLAQGIIPGVIQLALDIPEPFGTLPATASPWVTPAMQEVGWCSCSAQPVSSCLATWNHCKLTAQQQHTRLVKALLPARAAAAAAAALGTAAAQHPLAAQAATCR